MPVANFINRAIAFIILLKVESSFDCFASTIPTQFSNDTVDIRQFGAIGNGIHNDEQAFFNCFKYVSTHNSRYIRISKGRYFLELNGLTPGEPEKILELPSDVHISADGAYIFSKNPFAFRLGGSNINWNGGTIEFGRFIIQGSHINLSNINVKYSWSHSFHLSGGKCKAIDNTTIHKEYTSITLQACIAFRSHRMGFTIDRADYPYNAATDARKVGVFKKIQFISCTAIEPSYIDGVIHFSKYDFGFGVENALEASDVRWLNCKAIKTPGCGWHFEGKTNYRDIVLENCLADTCGTDPNGYPYSFMYQSGISFIKCEARGSKGGGFVHEIEFEGDNYSFQDCLETGYNKFTSAAPRTFYHLNPKSFGQPGGSCIYLGGASQMPVFGMKHNFFGLDSLIVIQKKDTISIPYIYNKVAKFSFESRPTSIASEPLEIQPAKEVVIQISIKELSGFWGKPYVYIQVFDSAYKLINFSGIPYLRRIGLNEITRDNFKHFIISSPLQTAPNASWVRVVIVLTDNLIANRLYAISDFSVIFKRKK
ncbi:MAG: hypothetical protein JSS98_02100 [Bacteroidetes bacterium]|nr:hypothetical protein [Bacteroidota bacterium]